MTVAELIAILQTVEPDRIVLINAPFQGLIEPNIVERYERGGIGGRYSFELIRAVELIDGNEAHIRANGHDVAGAVPWRPFAERTVHRVIPLEERTHTWEDRTWVSGGSDEAVDRTSAFKAKIREEQRGK